jgi:predicted permease
MSLLHGVRHVLWSLLHRRAADAETREELAYHLERQTEKHLAAGASIAEARRAALIELGGAERWREETAEARWGSLLSDLAADCRYAIRGLRARPGFALSALATLAIGIGAATAIFSVVDGALFRPLPFAGTRDVMNISLRMPISATSSIVDMVWSYPKFTFFRDRQRSFALLALHSPETLVIGGADGAERVPAEMAGASYFEIVGVRPAMGRTYTADEDRVGGDNRVVVISDDLWRTRFAGDPRIVGRDLTIGGTKHTIVGVMPPSFHGLSGDAQFWVPVPAARSAAVLESVDAHNMSLLGRRKPGTSQSVAAVEVADLGRQIDAAFPSDFGRWGASAYTLGDLRVHPVMRRTLALLSVAVGLLLAIVCVNLTILLLTRGAARRQELAVRLALGGSRMRLVRQLLTESVVLAAIGGLGALVVAVLAIRFLSTRLPVSMPDIVGARMDLTRFTFSGVHINGRTLAFALLLTAAIGVCIGIASALRSASGGLATVLRQGSAAGGGRRSRSLMSGGLVIVQVALALVFLVGSGLTIQSLQHTLAIPLGYDPSALLTVRLTLDPVRAQRESTTALWRAVIGELRALPGVRTVAVGTCSPIGMHCDGTTITPVGHTTAGRARFLMASPDYFTALRTPLVRGRMFEPTDESSVSRVMIVNREAARTIWGAEDPLTTPVLSGDQRVQVVGIVEDARYGDIERIPEAAIFVPFRGSRGVLFIRADGDRSRMTTSIRQAIRRAGAGHAIGRIEAMTEGLREATTRNRVSAQIFTGFALSALLLAAIGIYGALSLRVSQRTRELAIRRALGASTRSLTRMIGGQAAGITAVGATAGLLLGAALNRVLSALLFDVRPLEPSIYLASVLILVAAITLAAAIPTARSLRIDPREAMRLE